MNTAGGGACLKPLGEERRVTITQLHIFNLTDEGAQELLLLPPPAKGIVQQMQAFAHVRGPLESMCA